MKAVLYAVAGWLMALLAGIFLLGTIADEHHLRYAVIMVLFAAAARWCFQKSKGQKKKPAAFVPAAKPAAPRVPAQAEVTTPPRPTAPADNTPALTPEKLQQIRAAMVPKSDDDKTGEHDLEYTGVGLYRPKDFTGPEPQLGDYIDFELEPDNPYDSEAIVAKDLDGQPVGYLNKGRLREVVRRAIEDGENITAQISHTEGALKAYIGIDRNV